MVPVKNPDESIVQYIQKMNDATSRGSDAATSANKIGWFTVIVSALGTFLHIFFLKRYFQNGIDGFVVARLSSIYSLVRDIKRWEYQLHRRDEGSIHPPSDDEDVEKESMRYSV